MATDLRRPSKPLNPDRSEPQNPDWFESPNQRNKFQKQFK